VASGYFFSIDRIKAFASLTLNAGAPLAKKREFRSVNEISVCRPGMIFTLDKGGNLLV